MASEGDLEVYRQRYETFRHLDRLRWQMLQIAVTVGSLVLVFGNGRPGEPGWWTLAIVGLLLLIFGWVMERIRRGIANNGITLRQVGERVGDTDIPTNAPWYSNASFWIATTIRVFGLVCLISAYFLYLN